MSAVLQPGARTLLPMTSAHLDTVMAIEAASYAFPWSRGNFVDSLASGYVAHVLYDGEGEISATWSRWPASTRCTCST